MRPYSDKEMEEISRDPERLRAYFWRFAMNAKRRAVENRSTSRATGIAHPVTNYRPAFEDGRDLMHWASVMDRVAEHVLNNLDVLVETTLERDEP